MSYFNLFSLLSGVFTADAVIANLTHPQTPASGRGFVPLKRQNNAFNR